MKIMRSGWIVWLLAILFLSVTPVATYAYTGTQPYGNEINCFTNNDCPYGYTCPSTGELAQCRSISGQQFLACNSDSECSTGTCTRTPPKTTGWGTCQTCKETWAFSTVNSCYDDLNDCGTQYDLRKNVGEYPVCEPITTLPPPQCVESWNCGDWICFNSQITRGCTEINACGTNINKPITEAGACNSAEQGKTYTDEQLKTHLSDTGQYQKLADITQAKITIQKTEFNWGYAVIGIIILLVIFKRKF